MTTARKTIPENTGLFQFSLVFSSLLHSGHCWVRSGYLPFTPWPPNKSLMPATVGAGAQEVKCLIEL